MKKFLAFVLTFAIIISIFPVNVLAVGSTAAEDNTLVYVSIGDSMTNGYGLDGYDGESGVANYAGVSYANQFAAWLAGDTSVWEDDKVIFTGVNGIVDHRPLAMSDLRAEDLHWILELDYTDETLMQEIFNTWNTRIDDGHAGWTVVKDQWYGDWGFTNGDFRTWNDFCDYTYRYADAAAKILQVYNTDSNGDYFQSSYADDSVINNAKSGINDPNLIGYEDGKYFPRNKAESDLIGGYKYLQIATEYYQKSVADADVISLSLGNTNFGTYMLAEIMAVAMDNNLTRFPTRYDIEDVFNLANIDPEIESAVRILIDECDIVIDQMLSSLSNGDPARMEALRNVIVYCIASYAVNYIGSVDAILKLNPDVDIIQVALINTYADESEDIMGVTLGDIIDVIYTPVNAFLAALPTVMQDSGNDSYKKASFYYAETDSVACLAEVFGDDFYKNNDSYVTYPGLLNGDENYTGNDKSVVRDRFIANIVRGLIFDMLVSFGVIDTITIDDIIAYDTLSPEGKAAYAHQYPDKAKSIAMYLAFENATIRAGKGTVTLDSLADLNSLSMETFAAPMSTFYANVDEAGTAYLDDVATFIASVSDGQMTKENVLDLINEVQAIKNSILATYPDMFESSNHTGWMDVLGCDNNNHTACVTYNAKINELIYGVIAGKSNGYLDDDSVGNLYTAVNGQESDDAKNAIIYNTVVEMADNELLTVDVLENLYTSQDTDAAISEYITSVVKTRTESNQLVQGILSYGSHDDLDGILECTGEEFGHTICLAVKTAYEISLANAQNQYTSKLQRAVASVDKLWTAVNGVDSIWNVIESVESLCYLLAMPKTLSDAMVADPTVSGILCMNARIEIGTGIGDHPSVSGHNSLAAAVIDTYDRKYTSADATAVNVNAVISVINELIANHEEIYAYLASDPNVQAAYADATTAEYMLSEDSYYVSLGDGSVLSKESTFGYKLAEELGLNVDTQFKQLGIDGLRADDILYLLDPTFETDAYGQDITAGIDRDEYISEIKKADLITVGLGQNNISEFVMCQVMGYTVYELGLDDFIDATVPYELDWSHYLGKENVHYVDEELDKVYAELVANGVPESVPYEYAITSKISIEVEVPVAAILTYMAECYAYGYTGYAVTFAKALNAIHEINPDAEVIIVGMYNPVDGLILDMNGTEVALGDYVDTIVDVSNGYSLVYAAMTPKTTFVDAPEVEIYFDATGEVITMEAYFSNILEGGTAFNANENGHRYIKNMIFNSLTLTVKEDSLIGDINKDGKVNNIDATLALRYSVGGLTEAQLANLDINAGDVNSNGTVNNIDATIILRYSVGSVTVLPIVA